MGKYGTSILGKRKRRVRRVKRVRRRVSAANPRSNYITSRSSPVPDRAFIKLKYNTLSQLNYSGTLTAIQFRMNSLFDPDYSGIGHQPYGYDQWAQFYNRYRVYGCAYRITLSNTSTADQVEVLVQHRPNSLLSGNFETGTEAPYKTLRILPVEGSARPVTIKGYHNCSKIYGISKKQYQAEQDFAALINFNPPNVTFLNIYIQNQSVLTNATVIARVELTYFAEFYERKTLAQS